MEQRVDDQIRWYDRKSQRAQRTFKLLRGLAIVIAAVIPVLASVNELSSASIFPHVNVAVLMGALGAVVVIIASLISLGYYQENWTQYLTTCESLKHEKYRFLARVEAYDEANAFGLLVERVERLISRENSEWVQNVRGDQNEATSPHG